MPLFEIDIVDNSGNILGFGPIRTAQFFDTSDDLDQSGAVSMDAPRADLKTDLITDDTVLRCSTMLGTTWTIVGTGITDSLTEDVQPDQPALLEVSANSPLIALADRTVGNLRLSIGATGENPMLAADLLPAIMAYAPAGFTVLGTPSEDTYLPFSGESCLAALGKLASQIGDHFRYEYDTVTGHILRWLPKSTPPVASGIRAMQVPNPRAMDSTTCLITRFNRKRDRSKKVTRVWAYGGGNQAARIVLSGPPSYALPAGYAYDNETISGTIRYCIKHTALDTAHRVDAEQTFDDVAQVDTVSGHALSAKNALAQAAVVWLQRHIDTYFSYDIEVAGLTQPVLSGQTMRVVFDQFIAGRRIPMVDADLLVLSVKKRLDADNTPRIVSLTLASSDRWPEDDNSLTAGTVVRGQSQSAHLQTAARALIAETVTGTGGAVLTPGSVPFVGPSGVLAEDNADLFWDDTNNRLGIGTNAPAVTLDIRTSSAATTTQAIGFVTRHHTSGTPAAGFGNIWRMQAETSTNTNANMAGFTGTWVVATNGSQTGRMQGFVYDASAARQWIRGETDGTQSMIGFLAHVAVPRPAAYTLTGTPGRVFPADPTVAYTGIATGVGGLPYAAVADLNTLRALVSTLIGVINQMQTDLGNGANGYGLLAP